MKETVCEGLWNTVVDNPLSVTSKEDAERVPLSPDINFPTKIREALS